MEDAHFCAFDIPIPPLLNTLNNSLKQVVGSDFSYPEKSICSQISFSSTSSDTTTVSEGNEWNLYYADNTLSLAGVFDGHGGAEVAQYCKEHYVTLFKKLLEYELEKKCQESLDSIIDTQIGTKLRGINVSDEELNTENPILSRDMQAILEEETRQGILPISDMELLKLPSTNLLINVLCKCFLHLDFLLSQKEGRDMLFDMVRVYQQNPMIWDMATEEPDETIDMEVENEDTPTSEESTLYGLTKENARRVLVDALRKQKSRDLQKERDKQVAKRKDDDSESEQNREEENKGKSKSKLDEEEETMENNHPSVYSEGDPEHMMVTEEDGSDEYSDLSLTQMKNILLRSEPGKNSGTTATVACLINVLVPEPFASSTTQKDVSKKQLQKPNMILAVANIGDSRCILSRNGVAINLSEDHKPEMEREFNRITAAGGTVVNGRVKGRLNLSRSIGDFRFKENAEMEIIDQMIIALPDVAVVSLNPMTDEFIVLACDGVWNCFTAQEVITMIHNLRRRPNEISLSSFDPKTNNMESDRLSTLTPIKESYEEPDRHIPSSERKKEVSSSEPLSFSEIAKTIIDRCCATTQDESENGPGYDNVTLIIIEIPPFYDSVRTQQGQLMELEG